MIAEIAGYQNNKEVGERHSKVRAYLHFFACQIIPLYDVQFFEAAFDHADLKNQFEIMRARIDFPWRCVPLP